MAIFCHQLISSVSIIQFLAVSHSFFAVSHSFFAVSHSFFGSFSLSFWQFLTQFLEVSHSVHPVYGMIWLLRVTVMTTLWNDPRIVTLSTVCSGYDAIIWMGQVQNTKWFTLYQMYRIKLSKETITGNVVLENVKKKLFCLFVVFLFF